MGAAVVAKPSRLSTERSLCQICITVCSKDALRLLFGFDLGDKDLLRERERVEASHEILALEAWYEELSIQIPDWVAFGH